MLFVIQHNQKTSVIDCTPEEAQDYIDSITSAYPSDIINMCSLQYWIDLHKLPETVFRWNTSFYKCKAASNLFKQNQIKEATLYSSAVLES